MSENKEYKIRVRGRFVTVTEEVFLFYHRSKRRDRYYERDIKTETAVHDENGNIVDYKPAKEDSFDRLMEDGKEFGCDGESVEDAVIATAMIEELRSALEHLAEHERELIDALFFSNNGGGMTERDYAALTGVAQQSVNERKQRIFNKLKNFLKN